MHYRRVSPSVLCLYVVLSGLEMFKIFVGFSFGFRDFSLYGKSITVKATHCRNTVHSTLFGLMVCSSNYSCCYFILSYSFFVAFWCGVQLPGPLPLHLQALKELKSIRVQYTEVHSRTLVYTGKLQSNK